MIPPSPDIVFPFDLAFNCVSYNHLEVYLGMKPDTVKKAEDHFSLILPSTKSLFLSYCQQSYHFFRLLYIFNIYCLIVQVYSKEKIIQVYKTKKKKFFQVIYVTYINYVMTPSAVWNIYQKKCGVNQQMLIPDCLRFRSILYYTEQKNSTVCNAYFGYLFLFNMIYTESKCPKDLHPLWVRSKLRSELLCFTKYK